MTLPDIGSSIPSDPEVRKRMIAGSNGEQLEKLLEHACGRLNALSHRCKPIEADYAAWSAVIGEIEAERRKRAPYDQR